MPAYIDSRAQEGRVITFENVTKTYPGDDLPALEDITVHVEAGEFVFLVGASGSGKSTFLHLMIREVRPTVGRVIIGTSDVGRLRTYQVPRLRRRIGIVFQDVRLLPNKTVAQNVAFAMQVVGQRSRDIRTRVPALIERVGLAGLGRRMPHQLSGGEQQRVAIARALANSPALLIADEPTGNLDPDTTVGIMRLLEQIHADGTTVLMATHDAGIVDRMRKRVVELDGGRLVRDQARGVYGYA